MLDKKITIIDAIHSLCPDALWIIRGEGNTEAGYESLEWASDEIKMPSKQEVDDEVARLIQDYENDLAQETNIAKKLEDDRKSALSKLARLGLTEDEAKAVIGF